MIMKQLTAMLEQQAPMFPEYQPLVNSITQYVEEHLDDPNLTLKWIAENYLFMNVDYVSKKFLKETGVRFSNYLADIRIKKAKQLLASRGLDKIQTVAEEVGWATIPSISPSCLRKRQE